MTNGDKVRQMNNLQLYNWVVTQASGMTHDELLKWLNEEDKDVVDTGTCDSSDPGDDRHHSGG